ncbi:MAG: hypothetical protein RLZ12_622, partial [Bacillota bacterium]
RRADSASFGSASPFEPSPLISSEPSRPTLSSDDERPSAADSLPSDPEDGFGPFHRVAQETVVESAKISNDSQKPVRLQYTVPKSVIPHVIKPDPELWETFSVPDGESANLNVGRPAKEATHIFLRYGGKLFEVTKSGTEVKHSDLLNERAYDSDSAASASDSDSAPMETESVGYIKDYISVRNNTKRKVTMEYTVPAIIKRGLITISADWETFSIRPGEEKTFFSGRPATETSRTFIKFKDTIYELTKGGKKEDRPVIYNVSDLL